MAEWKSAFAITVALTGRPEKGPAEKLGEKIDKATDRRQHVLARDAGEHVLPCV